MKLLDGKVVAITGAGGGLGRAYALHMAKEGARLVINDLGGARDGEGAGNAMADQVVAEVKELGGEAVANYESVATMEGGASVVQTAVDAFGRLDVLVNNAGILRDKSFLKMDEEMWDVVMAVHLKGTFTCSLAAARQMKDQRVAGSIINTTSYAGLKGNFGQTNYGAAKAGIYAMTLVNAMELSRFDIRVNAIAPLAKTRMTEDIALVPDTMTADHVAPMVAFLASDLSRGVTGRIFGVHGGHMFEYKMQTTDGLEQEDWTAQSVKELLPQIAGEAPPAPPPVAEPAAAPAAAPASREPSTPQEQITTTFKFMPQGFDAAKAGDWKAIIHWEIAGTGDFTIDIGEGKCTSAEGKQGSADCVVKTDTATFLGITDGSVDGTQAFMQGKISATNVGALMKYQKVIDAKKAQAAYDAWLAEAPAATPEPAVAAAAPAAAQAPAAPASREPSTPQEKIVATFEFMPAGFNAARAKDWEAIIHWEIVGTGDFTITIGGGECTSAEGKQGSADCVVKTDTDTFLGITDGSVDGTQAYMQGKITATNVGALMKYQKVIDAKKAQAAYEAWVAKGPAAAQQAAPAAPAAAPAAPAPAQPAPKPAGPSAGEQALQELPAAARLRMLLGLLPELAGEVEGPDRRLHLEAEGFRCTVSATGGAVAVEVGHQGDATSRVVGTGEALWTLLSGGDGRKFLADAELTATSMAELSWLVGCCGEDPAGELAAEMESRGAGVNRAALGTAFHGDPIIVTEEEILSFAKAVNDPNPLFVDTTRDEGVVAPPLFPVRYYNDIFARVLTDPNLKVDVTRLLFGEMEMTFNLPVRPKDLVVVKAAVESIEDKESGQVMRLACRLMCEGEAVADSVATFFIRWDDSRIRRLKGPAVAGEVLKEVAFEESITIREDQTKDFAEASNDPNPIHLDEEYARSMGLPGIIVHGLCNMAFCGKAFVDSACEGDPERLRGLKVRFSRPAQPGQILTTRAYAPVSGEDGEKVYRFEARNDEGEPIITEGIARVR